MNTFELSASGAWLPGVALFLILSVVACSQRPRPASQASEKNAANRSADAVIEVAAADVTAASNDPCAEMFSTFFVEVDSISYNGYEVVRLHKTVHDKETGAEIPVTYVILKSSGRTIATFEGVYFGAGNGTDFGFASLLGGETKQLLVSQTTPRNGRHWIVDLSQNAITIFDSKEWDLGREDICIHDFDNDGVQEVSLTITCFWGFGAMSMAESPMPGVVFKYDANDRRYVPDRSAFARGLSGIEEDVQKINPDEVPREGLKGPYLATRLDIFLRYVYAGRENDGWTFFDRTYNLTDKEQIEREIKRILNKEPVYRFIYGKRLMKRQVS